jgi:hypothetical protein
MQNENHQDGLRLLGGLKRALRGGKKSCENSLRNNKKTIAV